MGRYTPEFYSSMLESTSVPLLAQPASREVPDLLSWVQCFSVFASVIVSNYPEKTICLLAYQTIIIHEARCCGRRSWLTMFQQQDVLSLELDWL